MPKVEQVLGPFFFRGSTHPLSDPKEFLGFPAVVLVLVLLKVTILEEHFVNSSRHGANLWNWPWNSVGNGFQPKLWPSVFLRA
jgi:hypothetical protein